MTIPSGIENRPAFITGSNAYGYPNSESDIDLVIYSDETTEELIKQYSDTQKNPIRFGRLNLIVATTPDQYSAWKDATEECKERGPVTKSEALAIHQKWRVRYNVEYDNDSGTA